MSKSTEIVTTVLDALSHGDFMKIMGLVARDVRWAVNAADRGAAPWFGVYRGRASLPGLFEAFATVEFTDVTLKAVIGEGGIVASWSDVAFTSPNGRHVSMQEVQIWHVVDGKIASVDTLLDTAAVGAAFA
jgi:ketosteroid isomerase-like protein